MKVLVVGASGVLGRALVPLLLDAGHTVRALSRHPLTPAPGLEPLEGDLRSADLAPIVAGCQAVVHAATAIPRNPSMPGAWALNTQLRTVGTRRLVAAAEAAGVERYVQQSIIMAYADGGDTWLDESAPFDPRPARTFIVAPVSEMESIVQASDLDWCILRGGQFAGPGTAQDGLIAALASGTATVPCDGAYYISPIHPADMASACAAAVTAPAGAVTPQTTAVTPCVTHATFNIVGEPLTYAAYVDRLANLRHLPPPRRNLAAPCPPSHRCTAAAAHAQLAWRPTHSIWPETR